MIKRDFSQYLTSLESKKFGELWAAQRHVLDNYASCHSEERDLAIELPTGAGKTLIALLIAGAWLNSNKRAVILSANKTLSRQMREEAHELRLPVAYMEGRGEDIPVSQRRAYQRARKIGIMNYWVYFNQNPVVDPAHLVVMDDAHLAEHCMHSLYSVMITRRNHEQLFEQLVAELRDRFPEYAALTAIADDGPPADTSAELLSFVDHETVIGRLTEIINSSPLLESDTDLRFRWMRLRSRAHTANLYIGGDTLWLRPYIYPLIDNDQYENATQVIYMSATVGDPGDLSRRLGVRPITRLQVPSRFSDTSSGRRLIVMNSTNDDSDIPIRMSNALLQAIRLHPKSLWLCSSENKAINLRDAVVRWLEAKGLTGHSTWILTSLGDEIDQFRRSSAGHLFVAGRFDGMDFQGDQCRIVVMSTLPRAINLQEEFVSTYLRDSGFMRRRLNQRIVQGLGRCTRREDDSAVYFLADQRFATHFSRESNREGIPRHMMGEIDLAQDLAEERNEKLTEYVVQFLTNNFTQYDADLSRLMGDVPPFQKKGKSHRDTSKDEVVGWTALFQSENYEIAQERFERCWNAAKADNLIEIAALHGWHRAKVLYLDGCLRGDASAINQALAVLEEAVKRGGRSSWFNRMRASIGRAQQDERAMNAVAEGEYADSLIRSFDDHLERLGTSGSKFDMFVKQIGERLNAESHGSYQEGLEKFGNLLGYRARRPRHAAATDCVWRGDFGNNHELLTFEAKIDHQPSSVITHTNVGQAVAQYNRVQGEYGDKGYIIRSLIVTHLEDISKDGASALGTVRLVSKDVVLALWYRVRTLITSYRSRWSLDDIKVRRSCAFQIRSKLPKTGWLLRAVDGAEPWISTEGMLKEWNE